MNTLLKMSTYRTALAAILVILIAIGCQGSGGGAANAPSGSASQGAVQNALVFADHATGIEANYIVDADEAATATMLNDDGTFTLAKTPDYDYVVVSQFGEYTLSNRPAMHMLAPAGARNISPLTTLVALNPNARAAIESLGVAYDADISTTTTPAVILLSQSIEAIVAAITDGLEQNGQTIPALDINVIQRALMAGIANRIQNQTAVQLTDRATLTAMLETAVIDALTGIEAKTAVATVSIDASAASAIVDPIVNAVAHAVNATTGTAAISTSSMVAQKAVLTPDAIAIINAAINNAADLLAALSQVVTKPINPPPIISGDPPTIAIVGEKYYFKPTVTDTDNDPDFYIFIIKNKPRWAKFNLFTGELSGTPRYANIGTTTGIVITVIDVLDCLQHASLPAFDITVMAPTGSTGGGGF